MKFVVNKHGFRTISFSQNYPNPCNDITAIDFNLPAGFNKPLILILYDIQGQIMDNLLITEYSTGKNRLLYNTSQLSPGLYYYKFDYTSLNDFKTMTVIK
ncbi:MAG: T9SS type A sorting domain-containing protein [Bacteroidia bacterium]|nr:T9SS type A sorting domain-containing protein [Bacteroidia bacterium]